MLKERKPPRRHVQCRGEARWRPLASERTSYHGNVKDNEKVIVDHIRIRINSKN